MSILDFAETNQFPRVRRKLSCEGSNSCRLTHVKGAAERRPETVDAGKCWSGETFSTENQVNATLKCDEAGCGWAKETGFNDIPSWLGVACPSCGKGEIVSRDDIAMWNIMNAAVALDKVLDPNGTHPRVEIVIDTAPMRKAAP